MLGQLRGFVEEYNVVFRSLKAVKVAVFGAVLKLYRASVPELDDFVFVVIPSDVKQFASENIDMVLDKFGICSSDDQDSDTGEFESEEFRFCSDRPRLSSASCYAPPKAICLVFALRNNFCFSLGSFIVKIGNGHHLLLH